MNHISIKKTILIITLLFFGCKKEDWVKPIPLGAWFNYNAGKGFEFSLRTLIKPDGQIPTNPFKVDSVARGAYIDYDGYWCTSSNKLTYVFPPSLINRNIIKQ